MNRTKKKKRSIILRMKRTVSCLTALCLTVLLTIFASPVSGDDGDTELAAGNEAYEAQSYESAIKHFRKAAEKGNAEAQFKLGYCLYQGLGMEQDYAEAVKWFRKAAEQGLVEAQFNLGLCFYQGQGTEQDYAEAGNWFRKAAEQGLAEAQSNLGLCFYQGLGTEQDYAEAVYWYRKSAEQGHAEAQYNLGVCTGKGLGTKQNDAEAFNWIRKAAEQGLPEAQYSLGVCYAKGIGVKKNRAESRKWYRKAAEQGFPEARKALGEPLSANMFRLRLIIHLAVGVFLLVLFVKTLGKLVRRHPRDVDDVDPDAPPARADLRWGARLIDLFFETVIVRVLGVYVFLFLGMSSFWDEYLAMNRPWAEEDSITSFVFSCCLIVLFAFILDSVINWAFGGTLGKWLFGIKIMRKDHNPLSFKDFFVRDIRVFLGGMALGSPLYIITMYIQYHRVSNGLQATYDESLNMYAVEYHASRLKTFFGFMVFILMIGAGIVVSKMGAPLFSFPAW